MDLDSLLQVIHEDAELLVINKPAGLVCHPSKDGPMSSLIGRVRLYLEVQSPQSGASSPESTVRPHLVNRLDRETSGVMIVAKTDGAALELRRLWESREVEKEYLAIVHGHVEAEQGIIDAPLGKDESSRVAIKDCVRADGLASQTEWHRFAPGPIERRSGSATGQSNVERRTSNAGAENSLKAGHRTPKGTPCEGTRPTRAEGQLNAEQPNGWTPNTNAGAENSLKAGHRTPNAEVVAPLANDGPPFEPGEKREHLLHSESRTTTRTRTRTIPFTQAFSLLRVMPRTGRKHQIRIHLAHIGHPIVGDKIYGGDEDLYLALVEGRLNDEQKQRLILPHQALHARAVRFDWRGKRVEFCCAPEAFFEEFLSTVQSPESRVHSPESRVQSPQSRVQSPESTVQSPESTVQSPESRVHSPQSTVHSPQSTVREM